MQLYCDPLSTACRPILMFAAEHELQLEHRYVSLLADEQAGAAYEAVNPNRILPFLIDGDLRMGEVSAILKYLADKIGSPTYPTELKARAKVNEAMDWCNTNLYRAFGHNLVYLQILDNDHVPEAAVRPGLMRFGAHACERWLSVLDRHMLGDRPFICGQDLTLADYMGASILSLGWTVDFDFSPYPNIVAWLARMSARPAWPIANAAFNGWLTAAEVQRRQAV